MKIGIRWERYDAGKFGRPWIGRVTRWEPGETGRQCGMKVYYSGEMKQEWGRFIGDCNGGMLEIEAERGDVVKAGQKSLDASVSSVNRWYVVVGERGDLTEITSKEAWEQFHGEGQA